MSGLFKTLTVLGVCFGIFTPAVDAAPLSGAQTFLAQRSERHSTWQDHGQVSFPSGTLFIADPTWKADLPIRTPRPAPTISARLTSYVHECVDQSDGSTGHQTAPIWIEVSGKCPLRKGERVDFVQPFLGPEAVLTKSVQIPDTDTQIHLISTGTDGGFTAVWLYDSDDKATGTPSDVAGRKGDHRYLDTLFPE